ncbi:MAG: diguanylate cyclase [Lawsonibacter sp.]|nr:diguanylate cyclase [Lawsonibacter sp.]
MAKSTEDILFDYLRDILFFPEKATIDLSELPPQYQKLGEGLQYMLECILENRVFVSALARGNLSVAPPPVENPIAAPAKELQGSLKHIVWQTTRVANEDYKQHIDFMGELSTSFNIMIEQLAERNQNLEQARRSSEGKNKELSLAQDFLLVLMQNIPEYIMLLDVEDNSEYVINRATELLKQGQPVVVDEIRERLWHHAQIYSLVNTRWDMSFQITEQSSEGEKESFLYYNVDSYPMRWDGRKAMAHIIRDRTEETAKEQRLLHDAQSDSLTGLYNRRYAMDLLDRWYEQNIPFCIAMVDVDHLKYCNDMFGHEVGDLYLLTASKFLGLLPGENILCRIGGDEFLVISKETSKQTQESHLESLRSRLIDNELAPMLSFTPSFSYGTSANIPTGERPLDDILREADVQMYQYKMKNKPSIPGTADYIDHRLCTFRKNEPEGIS